MIRLDLDAIRARRESLGINQQDMAEMLGMKSKADYSRYESGTYQFKATHVPMLAKALKTNVEFLFTQKVTNIETDKSKISN